MLSLKLWYLFFFASASCLYPFLNLIFRRTGLTESQVGTIAALRPWVSFSFGTAFSAVADKWRIHRPILFATFIATTIARLSVAAATSFTAILTVMLLCDGLGSPVTIMVDSAAMAACPKEGEYGKQRLYGAVGWGVFSLIAGVMMQNFGTASGFWLFGGLAVMTLVPTAMLPWGPLHEKLHKQQTIQNHHHHHREDDDEEDDENLLIQRNHNGGGNSGSSSSSSVVVDDQLPENKHKPHTQQGNFISKIIQLSASPEARLFFTTATFMGYAVGTIESFLFLFLEDLGGSETLMGLTLTMTCIAETAVFHYAGSIMKALGLDGSFHLCFLAFLVRLASYAALARFNLSVWCVLPVELLHGLTFGLTWSAGCAKCAVIAPPGLEATTQSAFQGLLFGLGHGIGGLVSGQVYHWQGPETVFLIAFVVVAVGWGLTSAARLAMVKKCSSGTGNGSGSSSVELEVMKSNRSRDSGGEV